MSAADHSLQEQLKKFSREQVNAINVHAVRLQREKAGATTTVICLHCRQQNRVFTPQPPAQKGLTAVKCEICQLNFEIDMTPPKGGGGSKKAATQPSKPPGPTVHCPSCQRKVPIHVGAKDVSDMVVVECCHTECKRRFKVQLVSVDGRVQVMKVFGKERKTFFPPSTTHIRPPPSIPPPASAGPPTSSSDPPATSSGPPPTSGPPTTTSADPPETSAGPPAPSPGSSDSDVEAVEAPRPDGIPAFVRLVSQWESAYRTANELWVRWKEAAGRWEKISPQHQQFIFDASIHWESINTNRNQRYSEIQLLVERDDPKRDKCLKEEADRLRSERRSLSRQVGQMNTEYAKHYQKMQMVLAQRRLNPMPPVQIIHPPPLPPKANTVLPKPPSNLPPTLESPAEIQSSSSNSDEMNGENDAEMVPSEASTSGALQGDDTKKPRISSGSVDGEGD
eukprot:859756_1